MCQRIFFVFCFVLPFGFCFGYDRNDIDALEKKTLEGRLLITSWQVVFSNEQESKHSVPLMPGTVETGAPVRQEFWYDGKVRMREDFTFVKEGHTVQDKNGTFVRTHIWGDDYYYSYFSGLDTDVEKWALTSIARKLALESMGLENSPPLTDIRLLGMVPFATFIANRKITDIIGNASRTELIMVDDNIDGIACKKISFLDDRSIPTSVWIAPNQGHSIIRIERNSEKFDFHTTMVVRVTKHEPSGIWFPTECLCTETDNAGNIRHRQDIRIISASFNSPIPDDIFTPKTMNVPKGTSASKVDRVGEASGNLIWDGNQIVNEWEAALADLDIPARNNVTFYLLTAIGLALICVGCLLKYLDMLKKRREAFGD
jgi:hypothetical protein